MVSFGTAAFHVIVTTGAVLLKIVDIKAPITYSYLLARFEIHN
jgi:hypothetical protein